MKTKGIISALFWEIEIYETKHYSARILPISKLIPGRMFWEDIHTYNQHLKSLHDDFEIRFEDMLTMDIPPWIINPFEETEVANVLYKRSSSS